MPNANKKRFNIIDAVLILAILVIVAGVIVRSGFAGSFMNKFEEGQLEYEFMVNSIKATSEQCFKVGEKLYSQTTHKEVGEIVSFYTRPAEAYIELSNGQIVKTIIPDRIDVIGVAKAKGTIDDDGRCMLDGTTHIAAGKNIYSYMKDITFMYTIEGVRYIPVKNTVN